MCLKKFKNVGERCTAENYRPVSLLSVVSKVFAKLVNDRIAVVIEISKAFDRVWHAGFLHKLKSYEISGQVFDLISSFLSSRRLQMVLDGSSQEYPINEVPRGSILGPTPFVIYINDLPDDVNCNVVIYSGDILSTLSVIRHLIRWKQLEVAPELGSDLQDWCRKWFEVVCWFQYWENSSGFIWPV